MRWHGWAAMQARACVVALAQRVLVAVKVRLVAIALFGVWPALRPVHVVGND